MWSDGYCTRVQWTGTPKYVCVAQGLMREVVAVLPDEAAAAGEGRSLQERRLRHHRRRRRSRCLHGQGAIPSCRRRHLHYVFTSLVSIILLL